MSERFVGLDVHANFCTFVIENEKGKRVGAGEVPTSAAGIRDLRERSHLPAGTPVALETGTTAFHVARLIESLGMKPVVVAAGEVRLKASRPTQKSDRRDALELCEGIRRGIYRCIVHVPEPGIGLLRETLVRRRHFRRTMVAEINAAKRLMRAHGLGRYTCGLTTPKAWDRLLARVDDRPTLRRQIECHRAVWVCASDQVRILEDELDFQQGPHQEKVNHLQTVPGVGVITALTVLAVFDDIDRFPTAKHAASYVGLVPSSHQSSTRDTHGHITKRGSKELRTLLCEAAHHASRPTTRTAPPAR